MNGAPLQQKNIITTTSSGVGNYARRGYQTARNTTGRAYTSYQGMSTFGKVLVIILIIAIIVAIAMWIRYAYNVTVWKSRDSPYLITRPVNPSDSSVEGRTHVVPPPVDGLSFTYSLWIYIKDWDYKFGQMKNIFTKGLGDDICPAMFLYPRTNALKASISTYNDRSAGVESCDIQNIPLMKWCHICYILNNRSVDIYINGRLERSCALRGIPRLNAAPVIVGEGGGFNGQIAKMRYFNSAITPSQVSEIYSEGPLFATGFLGF